MADLVQTSILRNNLAEILDTIEKKTKDYLLIAKKDKPKVALVNLDFFEDLLAIANKEYCKSVKDARGQIKKGLFYSHEDIFGKL